MVETGWQHEESSDGSFCIGVDDPLPMDPFGGQIRLTAADLADCPSMEEEFQRAVADARAERLVDQWWADPVAARADWDAQLADLYAMVADEDRREAVGRRVVLDGAPSLGSFAAVLDVLDGAAAWTPAQAGVDGFVDVLQDAAVAAAAAGRRLENLMLWLQVAHTSTVLTARTGSTPSLPRRTPSGRVLRDEPDALLDDEVAVEVAVAAGITRSKAHALVEAATVLVIDERLPLTAQALAEGRLDWPRLRLVLSRTRALTPENAQAVEARVYATRGVLEGGTRRFENSLTAAVLAVDPDAEARRREWTRKGRRVSIQTGEVGEDGDDGEALFTAVGPGEAITAAYNGLDAAARYLRANGDPRTLDQLRHDLFVTGCTSGYLPVPADVLPIPAGCVPTADAATGPVSKPGVPETFRNATTATSSGSGGSGSGSRTTDATTRTGSSEDTPGSAGDVEESVPAWFTTTWPDVQVTVNVTVSAETLMGLVDDPGTLQGYGPIPADAIRDLVRNGVFRCLVVDGVHGTVLGVGKNTFSPGYVASERLKLLVEHAHPTCSAPHCAKASWRCDLDHATPYAQGGATCGCNVRPLCRPCHRLKTAGLLVPEQRNHPGDPPGTITWTTRTGRTYTALPHTPLPHATLPRTSASQVPVSDAAADGSANGSADRSAVTEDPPPF